MGNSQNFEIESKDVNIKVGIKNYSWVYIISRLGEETVNRLFKDINFEIEANRINFNVFVVTVSSLGTEVHGINSRDRNGIRNIIIRRLYPDQILYDEKFIIS